MTATAAAGTSEDPVEKDVRNGLERSIGVGVAWKLGGQIAIQGIRLLSVAVLARLLTSADYGTAAIAITLATFAPTVADMGMSSALVQTEKATREAKSTAFWASVAFGISLSLILIIAAGPVGALLDEPRAGTAAAVGGLTFVIYSLGSTSQAMFMREMKFRSLELRYWVALVVGSAVAVVAALLGAGAWALVLQQVALQATFVAALWWRAGWHPTLELSITALREMGSFALRIAGGRWARLIELLALSLLIGKLVSVPALGAWTFAMSMVILPMAVIAIPISEVLFSAFSRLRGERDQIARLWLESIRYLAAVAVPLLVGLAIVAPDLIPVAFGAHWKVSVPIVQILSFYVIVRILQSWSSVVMDAVGKPEVTMWTQCAALVMTPVGVVVGAQWGVEGVALGFVLSQLVAVEIPMLVIVLSELHLSPSRVASRLFPVAAATLVMATSCLVGRAGLSELAIGLAGRAALVIALGLLVYLPSLLWLAPDIRGRLTALLRTLPARAGTVRRLARAS